MSGLEPLRMEIDQIDRELTALFLRRMAVTKQVGEYKQANGIPVLDAKREQEVLANKTNLVEKPEEKQQVTAFFEGIMGISRQQQRGLVAEVENPSYIKLKRAISGVKAPLDAGKVLFQGEKGAYAQEACQLFFGQDGNAVSTWDDLFKALKHQDADYGVVPIENSSTGSINQIYDLLAQHELFIVGEQLVKVNHCLGAPKGATLSCVSSVYSHEQGLLQCGEFLKNHPTWQTHARKNTAESAKYVAQSCEYSKAAICSKNAAKLYDLDILAENINTNQENYTRFVVVGSAMECGKNGDKISSVFTLPHRAGALQEVISMFAVYGLNLLKLESRPMQGRPWEYRFFVDFSGNLQDEKMDGILLELTQCVESLQILGNYKSC